MQEFFVSYNQADRGWAEWIAWTLEKGGHTTSIQAWDIQPGANFVLEMQRFAIESRRTLIVLSANYLASMFTQPEWAAAFVDDPTSRARKLLPVRVAVCEPPGLLKAIVYCDLVGLDQATAREKLLAAVKQSRALPDVEPSFPGTVAPTPPPPVSQGHADARRAASELLDLLETTRVTFNAQARLRNQLVAGMRQRLGITEHLEYEPFFLKYFSAMNAEEKRLHATMRAYTSDVLADYNRRVLQLVEQSPELRQAVPRLQELKQHLTIWLAKFQSLFAATPEMALVYVGVEEKAGFPTGIEAELRAYAVS